MDMKEYKQSINPYGVPHADMKIGKRVLVDIPINHDGDHAEVEGIISRDLWIGSPNCIYSQVKITMQNCLNHTSVFRSSKFLKTSKEIRKLQISLIQLFL